MKNQWKGFISGFITSVLILGLVGGGIAANYQKQATLNYRNIKITVDGSTVTPKDANGNTVEPFIIDGTTYLPVRAVASAVGYDVEWDSNSSTVKLTSEENVTSDSNSASSGNNYSRTNPAPVGTAQTVTVNEYWGSYTATVTLVETIRGQSAWNKIITTNQFNDPAPTGKEYILAKVEAKLDSVSTDRSIDFNDWDFTAFSSSGAEYEHASVVCPEPEFEGQAYAGATVSGWVVFVVDTSDSSPMVVFGADYNGAGGIWFSLS